MDWSGEGEGGGKRERENVCFESEDKIHKNVYQKCLLMDEWIKKMW